MNKINEIVRLALKEDIGKGDLTSALLIPKSHKARAVIISKDRGILCGVGIAKLIFKQVDNGIKIRRSLKDGSFIRQGTVIMNIEGPACGILTAERTVLNFLGRLSGIATLTHQFAGKIKPCKAKILDTRKTTPGLRYLEKYAVKTGGGFNHRMGLYDGVLIKDNHIRVMSYELRVMSLKELIAKIKSKAPKDINIEIEVTNLKEFKEALKAEPDIIMLDNMGIKDIKEAVKFRDTRTPHTAHRTPLLEASGGVNLSNVRDIAKTGVDRISVGALIHSAISADFSLEVV